MKKSILIIAISTLLTANCFAQMPTNLWAKQQDAGGSFGDGATSVATDNSANVIVTGSFYSATITFGTTTLTNATSGSDDIFIVKYDASGNVQWAKQQDAGGIGSDFITSVAVDDSGNVIVTGYFASPTITFGTTTLTRVGGGNDIFVVKYDSNGNALWAKQQDAGGTPGDYARSVATDDIGNVIITGSFLQGSITFGTTALTNGSNIAPCTFIVKYDGNGNVIWAKSPQGNSYGSSVAADANGNVYVTGSFMTMNLVFGSIVLSNTNWPHNDIYVVKYNANGTALWARKNTGGTMEDHGNSVAVDASGNVFVAGKFLSTYITFGTITLTNTGSNNSDIFIVKYSPSGSVLWARQQDAGGSGTDNVSCVAADASGNVLLSGSFDSPTLTFGTTTLTNAGGGDIYIVKYNSSGIVLWAKQQDSGGTSGDGANSITADASGNVLVAGNFNSPTITFGSTTLTSAGGSDMFITKLGTTTGISDNTFYNEVSVFPNPAINHFTIALGSNNKKVEVTITDITGKLIYTTTVTNTEKVDVKTEDFAKGIYVVQIQSADFTGTKKLVIEK